MSDCFAIEYWRVFPQQQFLSGMDFRFCLNTDNHRVCAWPESVSHLLTMTDM